jgi:nicotinate-nucleotide pyrophosphorylase (carboxylating)
MTDAAAEPPVPDDLATIARGLSGEIERTVSQALDEDLGSGDATSESTLPTGATCSASIVVRAAGVISGLPLVEAVFEACPGTASVVRLVDDGHTAPAGAAVATLDGDASAILSGERTALNFLGHLSGIATLTRRYVNAVSGTEATILDTRKTTPGLRRLEKYAVRCGGATNHRIGLYDAVLIKDNHLMLSSTLEEAVSGAREASDLAITVEVEDLDQLARALEIGADRVLLDNMSPAMMRDAVKLTAGRAPLEASGGINLDTVTEIAHTGVDFISVGSLTHSAPSLDVSLEVTA